MTGVIEDAWPGVPRLGALTQLAASVLDVATDERRMGETLSAVAREYFGSISTFWLSVEDESMLLCVHASERRSADDYTDPDPRALAAAAPGALVTVADLLRVPPPGPGRAVALPMTTNRRLLGLWALDRGAGDPPLSADEITVLGAAADIAALALWHARLLGDSMHMVDELQEQFEMLDSISDAIIALDAERRVVSWNAGARTVYGYEAAEVIGCDLFTLLDTRFNDADGQALPVESVLNEVVRAGRWSGEMHERRSDGSPLVTTSSLTLHAPLDAPGGLVVVNRDVTEQRREEHAAMHDPLTGLPNRRMLTNRLYEAYARACRSNVPLAVVLLDLDRFKQVNDEYGHDAGDAVLIATALRLASTVRNGDIVGRLGGDEFVVVLERAGSEINVNEVARRLSAAVSEHVEFDGRAVGVRASLGVAYLGGAVNGVPAAQDLLTIADEAMYEAKHTGGGVVLRRATDPAATERVNA